MIVGSVAELWRYPVKSLRGERLDRAEVSPRGIALDRWWSVRGTDGKIGSGKTTRRFRRMPDLLTMQSFVDPDGVAWVRFADGTSGRVEDDETASRLREVVGEPIELAPEGDVPHHDESPIHLLTDASLAWLAARQPAAQVDARRFRPSVVVTTGADPGLVEDAWIGRALQIGNVTLSVTGRARRCVMAAQAQEELLLAPSIVSELERANDLQLGVYATVDVTGSIAVGDAVVLG